MLEGRTNQPSLAWRWGRRARGKCWTNPRCGPKYQEERSGRGASAGRRSTPGEGRRAGSWIQEGEVREGGWALGGILTDCEGLDELSKGVSVLPEQQGSPSFTGRRGRRPRETRKGEEEANEVGGKPEEAWPGSQRKGGSAGSDAAST